MKACIIESFGGRDRLKITDLPTPEPGDGEVAARIRANDRLSCASSRSSASTASCTSWPFIMSVSSSLRMIADGVLIAWARSAA